MYCITMELRELRKTKGLTQADAARLAGVSLASYKNHELGRSKADSPLGRMIFDRISSYEKYGFDKGILPLSLIKEKIAQVFADKEVDFAYLFGSYAKGVATEKSDVDILISGTITGLNYFTLAGELERTFHKKVDLLRLGDLSKNQELLTEIMATGMRIYDKTEK